MNPFVVCAEDLIPIVHDLAVDDEGISTRRRHVERSRNVRDISPADPSALDGD